MPSHIKGFRRSVPGVINVRPATPDQPPTLDTKNLAAGLSANKALTKKAPKTASALTKGLFLSATHGTKKATDEKHPDDDILEKILNAQMIAEEAVSWQEFTENSTFHGIKYVFKSSFLVRRILWVLCVLGAVILFGVQVGSRILDFFEYETTVDVQLTYTNKIKFPSVTICNQNNFRTTKMVDNGLYYYLDEIYSTRGFSDVNMTGYDFTGMEPVNFLQDIAHQFEDLVDQCVWDGEPCDVDDFKMRFTDVGVCFTFNHNKKKPLKVKNSGSGFGLTLILNVEQYEYMKGPNNDAGVKILLHDQTEFPLMQDKGFAVAPGTHTIVVVDKKEVTSLPPPYGTCDKKMTGGDTRSDCLRECRTKQMVRACGCMDAYMDNSTINTRVCDVPTLFGCVKAAKENGVISDSDCNCGVPCFRHEYNPTMSYAQFSQFNIERLVLVEPENRERAETRFLVATEYSQRVVVDTAEADEEQLTEIMDFIVELDDVINEVYDTFHSVEAFQRAYNSPVPILNYEEVYRSEVDIFGPLRQAIYSRQSRFPGTYTTPSNSNGDMGLMLDYFFEAGNLMENRLRNCEPNLTSQAFDPTFDPLGWYAQNQGVWVDYDYELFFDFPRSYEYYSGNCHFYMDPDSYRGWYAMMYEALYSCYTSIDVCDVYVATKLRHAENIRSQLTPETGTNPRDQTADELYANYMSFIDGTFDGTYIDPATRPQHLRCLQTIEDYRTSTDLPATEVMDRLAAISAATDLDQFRDLVDDLDFFVTNHSSTFITDVIDDCDWYRDYMSYTWGDGICYNDENDLDIDCDQYIDYQEGLDEMQQYAQAIELLFYDISMKLDNMRVTSETKIRGRLYRAIESYLEMNTTKTQLAAEVESYVIQQALQSIVSYGDDVISSSQEVIQTSALIETVLQNAYGDLLGLVLPIITPEVLVNMTFFEYYAASNNTAIQAILADVHSDPVTKINELIETVYASYYLALEEARVDLDAKLDNMASSAEELEEMLVDYAASTRMNYAFYTDNFLQVDIFYKELSYEIIEQQAAFVFLSLLSEVGGFMGLLLGASILTVCELADYIVMTIAGKCHKKKEEEKEGESNGGNGDGMADVNV